MHKENIFLKNTLESVKDLHTELTKLYEEEMVALRELNGIRADIIVNFGGARPDINRSKFKVEFEGKSTRALVFELMQKLDELLEKQS